MKKILQNNSITTLYLSKLPTIYLVGFWAHYGTLEFKFYKFDKNNIPLVYHYNDYNGSADLFELIPITQTTTGDIITWTFNKGQARYLAEELNKLHKYKEIYRTIKRSDPDLEYSGRELVGYFNDIEKEIW